MLNINERLQCALNKVNKMTKEEIEMEAKTSRISDESLMKAIGKINKMTKEEIEKEVNNIV